MIWEPSKELIENTNVWRFMQELGFDDREAFLRFSRNEPERFWDAVVRAMGIEWFEPYQHVLDTSREPPDMLMIGQRLRVHGRTLG